MPLYVRPVLEAPPHRRVETDQRRPGLCVAVAAIFSLLLFAIFAVCAWNIYTHRFDWNQTPFVAGDDVAVSGIGSDFSTHFCDGYTVKLSHQALVFLLPHRAKVNKSNTTRSNISLKQPPNRPVNVKRFYLLEASLLDVMACRQQDSPGREARIVLIKGDGNLRAWRKNRFCKTCVLNNVEIPRGPRVDVKDRREEIETPACASLKQTIPDNDFYYLFVFYGAPFRPDANDGDSIPGGRFDKHHHGDMEIELKGKLERTHFNVSDATKTCTEDIPVPEKLKTMKCTFDLSWGSHDDIVVSFDNLGGDDPASDGFRGERLLNTKCLLRSSVWLCIFGVVPVCCCVCFSVLVGCFLCKRREMSFEAINLRAEKQRKSSKRKGKRRALLDNETDVEPDYGSVKIQD